MKKHNKKSSVTKKAPKVISQALLGEFLELRELCQLLKVRRQKIIELLKSGAKIEPGRLSADVEIREQIRVSWPKLEKLLGKEQVNAIRAKIEPTEMHMLRIFSG